MDEVPLTEMEDSKGAISISVEMPMEEPGADDDSQQAAEAMVQLGNMSYYQQNEGETNEQLMFKGHYICINGVIAHIFMTSDIERGRYFYLFTFL